MLLKNWLTSLFQVGRRLRKGHSSNRRKPAHFPVDVQQLETRTLLSSVGTTLFSVTSEANISINANVSAFNTSTTKQMTVSWTTVPMGATEGQDYSVANGSGSHTFGFGAWSNNVTFTVIDDNLMGRSLISNATVLNKAEVEEKIAGTFSLGVFQSQCCGSAPAASP